MNTTILRHERKKNITPNVIKKFCMQARNILTNLSPSPARPGPTRPEKPALAYNSSPCHKFHSKSFTRITTQIQLRLNQNAQRWIGKKVPSFTFNTKIMSNKTILDAVSCTEKFNGGCFYQWHMVVICILCSLFVTSQFVVILMFPN